MKKMMAKMWKNEKGFTLIELIIVIAILAVIAAIAVPNLINNINDARKRTDVSNAQLIANTLAQVMADNDTYAGTTVGTSAAAVAFNVTATTGAVLEARTQLQSVPTIKSKSTLADKNFFVVVEADGKIFVRDSAGTQLFPVPDTTYTN